MARAGIITVELAAQLQELEAGFRAAEQSLAKLGDRFQQIGARLTAGLTLPLAAAGGAAVKVAADFDEVMTKLITLASVSESQMQQWRKEILALAPAVGRGPVELGRALIAIASAGQQGSEAMELLRVSAKLSATGFGETEAVARALTAALNVYGKSGLTAARAADILAAAVDRGQAEASELAPTLGRVVGIAGELGVSFEQMLAFIATFTRLGVDADEAVTALRGTLNTLLGPSEGAKEALAAMGTSAAELRRVLREEGLLAVLARLIDLTAGNQDLLEVFIPNQRALAGVLGTVGSQAAAYAEILEFITQAQGEADKRFERTRQTVAHAWRELKAQAEVAAISVGEQLIPALQRLLPGLEGALRTVAALAHAFGRLPQPLQIVGLALAGLAVALGPVLFGIGTLVKTGAAVVPLLGRLVAGVRALVLGMTPLAGTIGLAVAAIASLGLAARQVVRHWDFFRVQFAAIWTAIRDIAFRAVEGILAAASRLPLVGERFRELKARVEAEHEAMLAASGASLAELEAKWEETARRLSEIELAPRAPGAPPQPAGMLRAPALERTQGPGIRPEVLTIHKELSTELERIRVLEEALGSQFDASAERARAYATAIDSLLKAGARLETVISPQGETLGNLIQRYQEATAGLGPLAQVQEQFARQLELLDQLQAALGDQFNRTREEASLYESTIRQLIEAGATLETVVGPQGETLAVLIQRYQALTATLNVVTEAQQRWIDMQREAQQVIESSRTPLERYNEQVARLNELHQAGLLSGEQFERALDQAAAAAGRVADIGDSLRQAIANAFGELGDALGDLLSGVVAGTERLGTAMARILGGMLSTVGKALIALGTAGIAFQQALLNPVAAIAAGIALVALGRALTATAQRAVSNAGRALAAGATGFVPPAEPSPHATGQAAPETRFVFEFQDPTSPGVVQRLWASVVRVRERDGLPVVSLPLAVVGVQR